jgi:hypothetical protein
MHQLAREFSWRPDSRRSGLSRNIKGDTLLEASKTLSLRFIDHKSRQLGR